LEASRDLVAELLESASGRHFGCPKKETPAPVTVAKGGRGSSGA